MLSKSQIKLITRLKQKKHRILDGFFIAEGIKVINELLESSLELHHLFTTQIFKSHTKNETIITEVELKKISFLTTPNKALAIFKIPSPKAIDAKGLIVALDSVRDPGNLGTIIRLCDWFGIKELVCSKETVDCYNPKVIQATMGSITRVNISYLDLHTFLAEAKTPIFGAFMDGKNIYKSELPKEGIIIMGNEANGISEALEKQVKKRIAIPRFGDLQATESLNVATATAILLSEFKRG
ncbi:MAG: RNA methyltransferase [Lacinutrix sp.]|uniref:RNA methyltransferase n=1 Tax=Lacinutrix sp. TaxID=1937692 RepID=UPI0030A438AC